MPGDDILRLSRHGKTALMGYASMVGKSKTRELEPHEKAVLERLRRVLEEKQISWGKAAKMAGKSEDLGRQWSTGRSFPTQRALDAIVSEVGVNMGWLLSGDDHENETRVRTKLELEMLLTFQGMPEAQQRAALGAVKALRDALKKN